MPRRCTICDHPQRAAIETALVTGEAYRAIAQRFAISRDAVFRHQQTHLPPTLGQAQAAAQVAQADGLLAQVQQLRTDAQRIQAKAEAADDLRTALQAIRELVRLVELLAKLHGALPETAPVIQVVYYGRD